MAMVGSVVPGTDVMPSSSVVLPELLAISAPLDVSMVSPASGVVVPQATSADPTAMTIAGRGSQRTLVERSGPVQNGQVRSTPRT
jgi:hypothetical protein